MAGIGLLLIRPSSHGFDIVSQLLPGMTLLATGLVATVTPLTSICMSAVDSSHGGIASAVNNAVSRLAGLIAVACMGHIAAGALSDASFLRLVQVSAVLFIAGAIVSAVMITNRAVPAQPVPCKMAALCRDRIGAQPALASSGSLTDDAADDFANGICSHTFPVAKAGDVPLARDPLRQPDEQLTASRFAPRNRLDK